VAKHRHSKTEIQEFSNKKGAVWKKYLKCREVNNLFSIFELAQAMKINDNFINIHKLSVTHSIAYSFSDVSSKIKQYKKSDKGSGNKIHV